METPRFLTSVEEDQVMVTTEEHRLEPAVLFEMLGATVIRRYNIDTPKEENIWLQELPERPRTRAAITELPTYQALPRVDNLIGHFDRLTTKLQNISDRQFQALVDLAQRRIQAKHRHDQ